MDLLIPKSWLNKFLETKATPSEFAKYLSLSGPSVEKITRTNDGDYIYSIEVTTNRVDTASVLGIAREASAILPRFGIRAKLKTSKDSNESKFKFVKNVKYLDVKVDSKLCPRFTAVLIKDVTVKKSPKEIEEILTKVGVRPISNIVDVTNYVMHELGQPAHVFDYDKIAGKKMILRESRKGETVQTLDEKTFKLEGGDIVIEDESGKLIDLCGIMGGLNSAVDENTKNILLFIQNYNQHKIRKTSMSLAQRSEAAVLFEKGLDVELVKPTIFSAISLIEKLSGGTSEKEIIDLYPNPYKESVVSTDFKTMNKIIGMDISPKDIVKYLTPLGFKVKIVGKKFAVSVPSFRSKDIEIPEDIAEEIARIYGYHNLPSVIMSGELPKPNLNNDFNYEEKIKNFLSCIGGIEVFNLSLVSKEMVGEKSLKLQNALGSDTEYLRTFLMPSLVQAMKNNPQEKNGLHLFEVSNVYISKNNDLPEERLMIAGIIKNTDFRKSKGIVEALLDELSIDFNLKLEDKKYYLPNQRLVIVSDKKEIGECGNLEDGFFYYEFDFQKLVNAKRLNKKYENVTKYPPQVEDLTLLIPEKTYIGEIIEAIKEVSNLVVKVELTGIFENAYTFNIEYQHKEKTLTDKEVELIREKVLQLLKSKFGINLKN